MRLEKDSIITIRKDLRTHECYGNLSVAYNMLNFGGKKARIVGIAYDEGEIYYRLDIDKGKWGWTLQMFERQEIKKKVNTFGIVKWMKKYYK